MVYKLNHGYIPFMFIGQDKNNLNLLKFVYTKPFRRYIQFQCYLW
jgi:hypothetical protein